MKAKTGRRFGRVSGTVARVMVTAGMGCMMALASRGAENKGEAEAKPGGAGELVQALELVRLVKQPYLLEFASAAGGRYVISRFNKRFIVRDYKAVLTLKVPGGEEQQFEVADGEAFALPYDAEAVEKPYTFKEVDHNEAVVIGWTADGVAQTRVLSP